MKAKIDLDKFVRSLMERYYEKIHIDPTTTECWLDKVLEDQGLEYKNGEIVEILQESEDERIRKELIEYFRWNAQILNDFDNRDVIAYLEKQGEQLYIRFGKIPTGEKSKIFQGDIEIGEENGVSVYPAFVTNKGDIVLGLNLPITKTTLHTQQHLLEYDDRPCYLVKGNYIGKDTDGQPLIDNVSIIRKIDSYRLKEEKVDNKHYVKPAEKQGEQKSTLRERYENIAQSEWFKKTHNGMSVSDDEPKWTDEDKELIQDALDAFEALANDLNPSEDWGKLYDWLASLKQRMGEQ